MVKRRLCPSKEKTQTQTSNLSKWRLNRKSGQSCTIMNTATNDTVMVENPPQSMPNEICDGTEVSNSDKLQNEDSMRSLRKRKISVTSSDRTKRQRMSASSDTEKQQTKITVSKTKIKKPISKRPQRSTAGIKKYNEVQTPVAPRVGRHTKNTRGVKKSNKVKTKTINKHSNTPCARSKRKPKSLFISKEIEEKNILVSIALNLSKYPRIIPFVRLQKVDSSLKEEPLENSINYCNKSSPVMDTDIESTIFRHVKTENESNIEHTETEPAVLKLPNVRIVSDLEIVGKTNLSDNQNSLCSRVSCTEETTIESEETDTEVAPPVIDDNTNLIENEDSPALETNIEPDKTDVDLTPLIIDNEMTDTDPRDDQNSLCSGDSLALEASVESKKTELMPSVVDDNITHTNVLENQSSFGNEDSAALQTCAESDKTDVELTPSIIDDNITDTNLLENQNSFDNVDSVALQTSVESDKTDVELPPSIVDDNIADTNLLENQNSFSNEDGPTLQTSMESDKTDVELPPLIIDENIDTDLLDNPALESRIEPDKIDVELTPSVIDNEMTDADLADSQNNHCNGDGLAMDISVESNSTDEKLTPLVIDNEMSDTELRDKQNSHYNGDSMESDKTDGEVITTDSLNCHAESTTTLSSPRHIEISQENQLDVHAISILTKN